MQGQRAAAEVMEALGRLDRDPDGRGHRGRPGWRAPSRTCCRSPTRGWSGPSPRLRTPVVSAIGHEQDRRCSTTSPTSAPRRRPTPPSSSSPTSPRRYAACRPPATGCGSALGGWLAREQAGLDALRSRPALGDPRSLLDARARRGGRAPAPGPAQPAATRSTGPATTSATSAPGPGPCPRWPRWSAATPCSRTPTGHVVTSVAVLEPDATISVRVADGRVHAVTTARPAPSSSRRTMADQKPGRRPRASSSPTRRPARSSSRRCAGSRPAASPWRSRWPSGSAVSTSPPSASSGSTGSASGWTPPSRADERS